jgi:hypothetical protein
MRTFCAPLRDERAETVLAPWAAINSLALPWMFCERYVRRVVLPDGSRRRPTALEVRKAAQKRFGLTKRQALGLEFDLAQMVASWIGALGYRVAGLHDRLKEVSKEIAGIDKKLATKDLSRRRKEQLDFRRHQKQRHRGTCADRLAAIEKALIASVVGS